MCEETSPEGLLRVIQKCWQIDVGEEMLADEIREVGERPIPFGPL